MDGWNEREHDHLVEPLFGGLRGGEATRPASLRALWAFIAVVAVAIAARAWRLAA